MDAGWIERERAEERVDVVSHTRGRRARTAEVVRRDEAIDGGRDDVELRFVEEDGH